MRRFWVAAGILLALLVAALGNAWYVEKFTGGLAQQLEQARELAAEENWEQARKLSQQVLKDWEDHQFYLHVFMRHSDTDQIFRTFQALEEYLKLEEPDQYTAANADLVTQLELLGEMEQLSWMNIL